LLVLQFQAEIHYVCKKAFYVYGYQGYVVQGLSTTNIVLSISWSRALCNK